MGTYWGNPDGSGSASADSSKQMTITEDSITFTYLDGKDYTFDYSMDDADEDIAVEFDTDTAFKFEKDGKKFIIWIDIFEEDDIFIRVREMDGENPISEYYYITAPEVEVVDKDLLAEYAGKYIDIAWKENKSTLTVNPDGSLISVIDGVEATANIMNVELKDDTIKGLLWTSPCEQLESYLHFDNGDIYISFKKRDLQFVKQDEGNNI